MIVRVKKICQIGGFHNFQGGGSVPFADNKKVVLVSGMNTLGKTTFVQILKSLGTNDPTHIQKRHSIPPDPKKTQEVELSYLDLSNKEKTVKYNNDSWSASDLTNRILVFDHDFINTHVILGDSITRDNKEFFTDFVLGSEGVKLSQQIEKDKKDLRQLKTRLVDYRPELVRGAGETEVSAFINLTVSEDTPTLEKAKETDEKRLHRLNKVTDFKKLAVPEIDTTSAETSTDTLRTELSVLLAESYEGVSDEAWKVLRSHIQTNCKDEHAVGWLKTGLELRKGQKCPFCAQDLNGAKALIGAYQTIFDDKFEAFEKNLRTRIRSLESDIKLVTAQSFVAPINRFLDLVKHFEPFIQELEDDMNSIEEEIKKLENLDESFKKNLATWAQAAQDELGEKSSNIHKAMSTKINSTPLISDAKKVAAQQSAIRKLQQSLVDHIERAKAKVDKLTPEQLAKDKERREGLIALSEKKIARITQDKQCALYQQKQKEIVDLKKKIDDAMKKLEDNQSEYLDEYFERLDYWFKQLGSDRGFSISKESTAKGDKKVYSLAIKYHGQKIAQDDLGRVFSESDKRNLALAVFLSRAEKLINKKEMVLVFDDPVVSFDDNRRKKTCRELKLLANDFRQIIVTTHYSSLIKHFYEVRMPAQYVKIVAEGTTSRFKPLDAEEFAMSPHHRESDKLLAFVDGSTDNVKRDLRPFMEEHLRFRFQQQIKKNNIPKGGLEKLITDLNDVKAIGGSSAAKLHIFRESRNPEHHIDSEVPNIEELRNEASDLLDLLYGPLE